MTLAVNRSLNSKALIKHKILVKRLHAFVALGQQRFRLVVRANAFGFVAEGPS